MNATVSSAEPSAHVKFWMLMSWTSISLTASASGVSPGSSTPVKVTLSTSAPPVTMTRLVLVVVAPPQAIPFNRMMPVPVRLNVVACPSTVTRTVPAASNAQVDAVCARASDCQSSAATTPTAKVQPTLPKLMTFPSL